MVTFNVYKSTSSGAYVEGVCLATDTKPIAGITNGSILYAVDITDGSVKRYMFNQNAATWVEAEDPCAGGGGSGGVFWVTYGTTTIDELNAAYQAGKVLMLEYQNSIYYLEDRTSTMYVFHCMENGQASGVGITLKQILYTSTYNTWAYYEYDALAANQYPQNAGKFLAVGNDGKVTPVNAPSGSNVLVVPLTITGGDGGTPRLITATKTAGEMAAADVLVYTYPLSETSEARVVESSRVIEDDYYTFVYKDDYIESGYVALEADLADDYPTATGG